MNGSAARSLTDASVSWQAPGRIAPGLSPGRGRALFAAAAIAEGEVVERVCTIPLTSDQCDALEEILPLGDYYFRHPEDPDQGLILLGLASLANHADDPNVVVRFAWSASLGWIAELVAVRSIATGEEITHRYRCPPWFQLAG